ncbi:MAG: hypothetical protein U1F27_01600 [Turneriella sp.]
MTMRKIRFPVLFFATALGALPVRAALPVSEMAGLFTGAVGIGANEYYKADLVPQEPRWKTPPAIDAGVRKRAGLVEYQIGCDHEHFLVWRNAGCCVCLAARHEP